MKDILGNEFTRFRGFYNKFRLKNFDRICIFLKTRNRGLTQILFKKQEQYIFIKKNNTLGAILTPWDPLQHPGSYSNTLGSTPTPRDILQHSEIYLNPLGSTPTPWELFQYPGIHSNTLGYTSTLWDIPKHSGIYSNTLGAIPTPWDLLLHHGNCSKNRRCTLYITMI